MENIFIDEMLLSLNIVDEVDFVAIASIPFSTTYIGW